ncbi:DUF6701 domain-containing protein [Pseudoduganella sp. GCM10020061]|uniref:DUF6701 domain-containing protein n=1 Tax=Pseudoduganella sp. GCM10020061 TaxID=3317345 RepID=UPI0036253CE1
MILLRTFLALILVALAAIAQAQTPVSLYESFAGNVNFTGTQKTIRTGSNQTSPCSVVSQNTYVSATLSGIPSGATVLRAILYWAGSGATPDYSVALENTTVNAPVNRQYRVTANGRSYFGGAADVTSYVASRGNGTYRFRRLTVDTQSAYCQVEGVTGGFALLVVYSHASEPFRVLNVYEGFQPTYYSNVILSLSNFRIPNPLGSATGRIGHITWEGDSTLGNTNAEDLFFNEVELYDTRNPRYNQFNSSSNINNDAASYGIDFDAYTVAYPTIQAGQTVATTRYQSGQDLVLLHSEVVAVPNVPVSDLATTMTVANQMMTLNVNNSYTIRVTNNGPNTEPGPIVVTDMIAPELAIVSVAGTGWSCTTSGRLVTCTRAGTLAAGAVTNPITITVRPTVSPPIISNSATATGQNFDNNEENSTATVVTGGAAGDYVFTDAPCTPGLAFSDANQPCKLYQWDTLVAGTDATNIYITALDTNGRPKKLHNNQAVTVNFYFGLSCINPATTANVVPTFTARNPMTVCAPNGTKPVGTRNSAVTFAGGLASSSVAYSFRYQDVGQVQLYMVDDNNNMGSSSAFVVKPDKIVLSNILQTSTSAANPAATTPTGAKFVRAGEAFSMTISARSATNAVTPNFGRELVPETFKLVSSGAIDPATSAVFAEMTNIPGISGSFGAITAGQASGANFSWPEVGILSLIGGIASANYLNSGDVPGESVNVGRFFPHHFDTVTDEPMPTCPASMACPAGVGAAYSGQPFEVEVSARNAANAITANYNGRFARQVTLSAWSANGSGSQNPPASPVGSVLSNPTVAATAFDNGTATVATPAYTFPNAFTSTAPRGTNGALDWVPPTTIYLRAIEAADSTVTSAIGAGSQEGPIHIVAGRLLVPNAYGSDLINLPVEVRAQYWSGARWENSITDSLALTAMASVVTPTAANLEFSGCTGGFAANCATALSAASAAGFALESGAGTFRLRPPGAAGSVLMKVNGIPWLPSTAGKIVFGVKKAPVDYIREVY